MDSTRIDAAEEEGAGRLPQEAQDASANLPAEYVPVLFERGSLVADRFEIDKRLGLGTTGAVYRVRDRTLDQVCALRFLLPSLLGSASARERFLDGMKTVRRMRHEGIAALYNLGEDPKRGVHFLAMEYVEGIPLRRLLESRGGTLPTAEAVHILRQLCTILAFAQRFTAHGNLTPSCIMIRRDWTLKILDFGLATFLPPARRAQLQVAPRTRSGAPRTVYYQAPERSLHRREPDHRSDLFSLAAIFYELLTGEVPAGRFELPSEVNPGLPRGFDEIVLTCLHAKPEKRYRDAAALAKALENALEGGARDAETRDAVAAWTAVSEESADEAEQHEPGEVRTFAGIEMVWIPPGSFTMGSGIAEEGREVDERSHKVTLSTGYWLGKYPVTQAQWERVMQGNPSRFLGSDHPVDSVTWEQAQEFARRLNASGEGPFRLPTEAEWEYACRAGTTTRFSFGDKVLSTDYINYDGSAVYVDARKCICRRTTMPVTSFAPNPWGLHDMHGNVWEWCQDWQALYPAKSLTDPKGPAKGSRRVVRGGGWSNTPASCRSASRYAVAPDQSASAVGFRLCRG